MRDAVWVKVISGGGYDLDCISGDSGGSYFWGSTAWGIHSGSRTASGGEDCVWKVVMSIGVLGWDGAIRE